MRPFLNAKNIVVTAANGRLGNTLAKIINESSQPRSLVLTTREHNVNKVSKAFPRAKVVPFDLENERYKFPIPLSTIDLCLHCAAPYHTTSISEASMEMIRSYAKVMSNEWNFLMDIARRMNSGSHLAACGSISVDFALQKRIGLIEPVGPMSNGDSCSLHAAHKSVLRSILKCIEADYDFKVTHFNLDAFVDNPTKDQPYLATSDVAKRIISTVESSASDKGRHFNVDIVTDRVAQMLKEIRQRDSDPLGSVKIHRLI